MRGIQLVEFGKAGAALVGDSGKRRRMNSPPNSSRLSRLYSSAGLLSTQRCVKYGLCKGRFKAFAGGDALKVRRDFPEEISNSFMEHTSWNTHWHSKARVATVKTLM